MILKTRIGRPGAALLAAAAAIGVGLYAGTAVSAASESTQREAGRSVVAEAASELGLSDRQSAAIALRSDELGGFLNATLPSASLRDGERSVVFEAKGARCLVTTLGEGVVGTCADEVEAKSSGLFVAHQEERSGAFDVLAVAPDRAANLETSGSSAAPDRLDASPGQVVGFRLEHSGGFSFEDQAGNQLSSFELD